MWIVIMQKKERGVKYGNYVSYIRGFLETWFLQGFEGYIKNNDGPAIWLGLYFKAYENINNLLDLIKKLDIYLNFPCEAWEKEFYDQCNKLGQSVKTTNIQLILDVRD
jgi:hypothetical protein